MNAIDVRGLNKFFGPRHVVRDVSIAVQKGTITGFLGPNGSGKTTTLRLLCGLLTPDSGEGTVLGRDFRRESTHIKKNAGYMTQRFSLYEDMTAEENLLFAARVYELPDPESVVRAALERLGLQERGSQLSGTLSGGWKQRLALAAATLHSPQLLLLDEPTAGVDPKARRLFWDDIHAMAAQGMTVLVSTHYMDEAERCHAIAYILNGSLVVSDSVQAILASSGIVTLSGTGPDMAQARAVLACAHGRGRVAGVESVSFFGSSLHVSGKNRAELLQAVAPFSEGENHWEEVRPTLEDVFIRLMDSGPAGEAVRVNPSGGQPAGEGA